MTTITPKILLQAYAVGIFPMAETAEDNALYWVEPEERGIIPLRALRISHSLRKQVRRQTFEIRIDSAFSDVIGACAAKTKTRKLTWINTRIRTLYNQLHKMGHCHSVECWRDGKLVGGLYGVGLGRVFFGESMFTRATDASKIALARLVSECVARNVPLIDCQMPSPHLASLGSRSIPRWDFEARLAELVDSRVPVWRERHA